MASVANLSIYGKQNCSSNKILTTEWRSNHRMYILFNIPFRPSISSLFIMRRKFVSAAIWARSVWAVLHSLTCVTYWRCLRERGREVSGDFCCLPELWMETEAGCWRYGCLSVRRSGYRHSHSTAPDQTLTAPTNRKRKAKAWQMHFWWAKMKHLKAANCKSYGMVFWIK